MFTPRELALERGWPGRIEGDKVIQLAAQTLQSFFTGGGSAREHAEYALADVDLRPPVLHPPTVRDFMAFEEHVATARRQRGSEVPKEWYEVPVFYFSNPTAIFGPEDAIPYPEGTEELDYELECAAVIGADGAIGGFTVLNDWSARDLQRQEMRVGLGPAKGKDFATSLGPVLVTPDEFDGSAGDDDRARERRGALARGARRDVPRLGGAARAGRAEHRAAAGRRDRVGHRRQRLHPRARRRALAAARRRRRARDRRHRRAAQHRRVIGPADVRAAARVLDGVAHRTPVVRSRTLGEQVVLKPECLQRAGAFKFRGAYNKISSLPHGDAGARLLVREPRAGGRALGAAARVAGDDPDAEGRARGRRSTRRAATAPRS